MNKILSLIIFSLIASSAIGQTVGIVDKKTKEFSVPSGLKMEYSVFGYQYPNNTTRKMICFSSNQGMVRDSEGKCPLGGYFDTDRMKPGDKIVYLGVAGKFGKMTFISGSGKKTIFYLPKSGFVIK
jgi:hypothetical protein